MVLTDLASTSVFSMNLASTDTLLRTSWAPGRGAAGAPNWISRKALAWLFWVWKWWLVSRKCGLKKDITLLGILQIMLFMVTELCSSIKIVVNSPCRVTCFTLFFSLSVFDQIHAILFGSYSCFINSAPCCNLCNNCILFHNHGRLPNDPNFQIISCQSFTKKSRIRETKHLSTNAGSSTDAIGGWTKNTQEPNFFEKR